MSQLVPGLKLSDQLKAEVLNAYKYRWTTNNEQRVDWWADINNKPTTPLISDEEWLATHAFWITKSGKLDARMHYAKPI